MGWEGPGQAECMYGDGEFCEKESLVRARGRNIPACLRRTESGNSKFMYLLQKN